MQRLRRPRPQRGPAAGPADPGEVGLAMEPLEVPPQLPGAFLRPRGFPCGLEDGGNWGLLI